MKKVEICGVNTSKLPLLTNEEKTELLVKIKEGDEAARIKYIIGNLRLVLSTIQRFNRSNEFADDLFQVGCIGLIKAIDNFDLSHNVKFSTYAVPMIIGEVRRYLRDNNSIRVSRSLRDIAYKALQVREKMIREKDEEPSIMEIAKVLEIPFEDVVFALDAIQEPVSLNEPIYNDGGDALYVIDQIKEKKQKEENWVQSIALKDAMKRLSDREHEIIKLRFFQGKTQMEVADEISISQAQVSRLEKTAIKNMKKYLN